jgi:fibronectin type 3 domain-containing protein
MRFCLCLVFLLFAACGKEGAPQPPFIRIPEAVKDLAATQSGHNIILTWTSPRRYVDGSAATNLTRVQIREKEELLATVNASAGGQAQSYPIAIAAGASNERRFTIVIETSQRKRSEISNTAVITPTDVPGQITAPVPVADQRRIFLRWEKPQEHPELADAYVVVRTDLPAEAETVSTNAYEDQRYQPGKTFTYQVTAIRRLGGTTIMGVGPVSIQVTAEDKTPPAVPHGLELTATDTGAYLTWDANSETDLSPTAAYRVFRSEHADSGFKLIAERTTNLFFDPMYQPDFYYAVSAVDESKNESKMSAPFRAP